MRSPRQAPEYEHTSGTRQVLLLPSPGARPKRPCCLGSPPLRRRTAPALGRIGGRGRSPHSWRGITFGPATVKVLRTLKLQDDNLAYRKGRKETNPGASRRQNIVKLRALAGARNRWNLERCKGLKVSVTRSARRSPQ